VRRVLPVPDGYDFARTVGILRNGGRDPSVRLTGRDPSVRLTGRELWRASRTPDGAGTVHLRLSASDIEVTGYGPGGDWLVDRADRLAGLHDDPAPFRPLARLHPVVAVLADAMPGIRLARTDRVYEEMLRAVLAQKVTTIEATASYAKLVRRLGEPAPGPAELIVPPAPETVAGQPYWTFHPMGIEQKRANTLRRVATAAASLERLVAKPPDSAQRAMTSLAGIGAWTAAEVSAVAFGDPDAVSVGDFHVPHQVAHALAGEPRGTDERMLEQLTPFAGHRARVIRLIVHGSVREPRRAPRMPIRSFARY